VRATGKYRTVRLGPLVSLSALPLSSCSRAPSVDLLGSFFPAWLICLTLGILLTALARLVLLRLHMNLDLAALAYPSLAALFTFALWLIFFH
jgi:YtcA family